MDEGVLTRISTFTSVMSLPELAAEYGHRWARLAMEVRRAVDAGRVAEIVT